MSPSNRKYYSGFLYDGGSPVAEHCTHCYFGTRNYREVGFIVGVIDAYFMRKEPVKMPIVSFDTSAWFEGDQGSIRVLLTKELDKFEPFKEIRTLFAKHEMISTKYPNYRPHISTDSGDLIMLPFLYYALVCNGEIVTKWPIEGFQS